MDDLKRPPNVSSEETSSESASEVDINNEVEGIAKDNPSKEIVEVVSKIITGKIEESTSSTVVSNYTENNEKIDSNKNVTDSENTEKESDLDFCDMKTVQIMQKSISNSVPTIEISHVTQNKNIQPGRKMSIEKSASHSDFVKAKTLDPKYMSTQTLPDQGEKIKKKKKNLFSSIKKFLSKKKSKSVGKSESNLFADRSLQNIYSDTWNQRQLDEEVKRATFDDELFETFRKSKLEQVASFIQNEQEAQVPNNFDYLKNMGEENGSLQDENLQNDMAKEVTKNEIDSNTCKTESECLDRMDGKSLSAEVAEKAPETCQKNTKECEKNELTTVRTDEMKTTLIDDPVTVEEDASKDVNDTKTSTERTNKSNSSTLERRRNNNSQPIQVMLDNSEHPCGDIIVHVDSDNGTSDNSSESIGNMGTSVESSPELQRHLKDHETGANCSNYDQNDGQCLLGSKNYRVIEISDQERASIITEIDKIFEDEGLNITFDNSITGIINGEIAHASNEGSNKSIRLSNNFSLPATLDRSVLITKQEQIHSKNIRRKRNKITEKAVDSNDELYCSDSDNQARSKDEKSFEESIKHNRENEITSRDSDMEEIGDKIVDKFDVDKIDMQKSFLVPTVSFSSESNEHETMPNDAEKHTGSLEEYVLRNSLRHKILKPKNSAATLNFSVNPIYSQEVDVDPILVEDKHNDQNSPNTNDEIVENVFEISEKYRENDTSTPDNSFLDTEYSFHLRKTPESGYSSTVETVRGTTPDLASELRKVSECEEIVVPAIYKLSEGDSSSPCEIQEEVDATHGKIDEKKCIDSKSPEEISTKCSNSSMDLESHRRETNVPNKLLLEPGIILDERIVLERRNILSQGSPIPCPRNRTNISTNSRETNVFLDKEKNSKGNNFKQINSSKAGKDLIQDKALDEVSKPNILQDNNMELALQPPTDLGGQLSVEFEKLTRVFSQSVENLAENNSKFTSNDTAQAKSFVQENVEPKNVDVETKRFSQDAEGGIVPYDHLKELSNARNTAHYNTRL